MYLTMSIYLRQIGTTKSNQSLYVIVSIIKYTNAKDYHQT